MKILAQTPFETAVRFWTKVDFSGDCWNWTGARNPRGYGTFSFGRRTVNSHRMSVMLTTGVEPVGLSVCHRCDNPKCVKPAHLFCDTQAVNMRDKFAKGRDNTPVGERSSFAKLTPFQVEEIFKLRAKGLKHSEIAARFGICTDTVSKILRGVRWGKARKRELAAP